MRLNNWLQFWFEPTDSRVYRLMRISFSIVSFINLLQLFPDRYALLSDQGTVGAVTNQEIYFRSFSLFWVWGTPTAVDVFMLIAAIACIAVAFGILTRAALIVLFLWNISYVIRIGLGCCGWDLLLLAMSTQLMISPLGKNATSPIYALRLLQFQVTIMYWHTVLSKLEDPHWAEGSAVAYFFMGGISLFKNSFWSFYPWLTMALTYGTLIVETTIPFLLWNRKTRLYGFLLGYGFHGIILLTTNIPLFSVVVMVTYLSFLTGEDLTRLQRFFKRPFTTEVIGL